jgi:tripartite-type tricarboxylate transporter receptor subunit TctC
MQVQRVLLAAFAFAATLAVVTNASAQAYPTRTVTIVVPFPPGSSPDGIARILGTKLADRLGKSFVVDNRPGASSLLGTGEVAKAPSDGYTLLVGGSSSFATGPALRKVSPYDPPKDFRPLALIGHVPFVLVVNPSLPVHSVADLIKIAKAKPGELSYGSGGPGHTAHIYAELLKSMTDIQMVHVPYKGSPPALNDVIGGHIQLMFGDVVPALPLIEAGKVRALAVSSGIRLAAAPDIPTVAEAGVPGFDASAWIMIVAPAKTPVEIVDKLRSELLPMLEEPGVQAWIVKNGMIPAKSQHPDELQQFMSSEYTRWRGLLKKIGIAGSQ